MDWTDRSIRIKKGAYASPAAIEQVSSFTGREAEEVRKSTLRHRAPRIFVSFGFAIALASGCRQMPVADYDKPEGTDETFVAEKTDDTVPIEKELAAPKGFFSRKGGPTAAWSKEARDIERSLGVGR
ncbi:hypothetical protein GC170_04980 [bacterium]|nr:hypothetical protein [bacterium]